MPEDEISRAKIDDLEKRIYALEKVVTLGNGQPSLVAQIAGLSRSVNSMSKLMWIMIGEGAVTVWKLFLC